MADAAREDDVTATEDDTAAEEDVAVDATEEIDAALVDACELVPVDAAPDDVPPEPVVVLEELLAAEVPESAWVLEDEEAAPVDAAAELEALVTPAVAA